ncbi:MAG: GDP-mannose 4,6-dehydratase, partial [Planctomycetota bacterium]
LRDQHGDRVEFISGDVRNQDDLRNAVISTNAVYHFAAQVAVTTSLEDPIHDFDVNARGTLNLLEVLRELDHPPSLLFTSTNKVYGSLEHAALRRTATRYEPVDPDLRHRGIDEHVPLDFQSPYGCSKGFADQAVLDYARSFGLRAVVFRMSCIYGKHQCGTEDQGWVAHFLLSASRGEPITLFGDGRQVRDVLFADDLVEAMLHAERSIDTISGEAFNIGGGVENTTSLVELLDLIEDVGERPVPREFQPWRTGDQRYYTSDIRRFTDVTGWSPRVSVREGVTRLLNWIHNDRQEQAQPNAEAMSSRLTGVPTGASQSES